jgi:hypothetical protein
VARWTLRAKGTVAALGVAIVPMAALGLLVLDIQRKGLSRAEKELEAAVVDEAATSVLASFEQAHDVANRVNAIFADDKIRRSPASPSSTKRARSSTRSFRKGRSTPSSALHRPAIARSTAFVTRRR